MQRLMIEFAIKILRAALNRVRSAQITIYAEREQIDIYDTVNGTIRYANPTEAMDEFYIEA